MKCAASPFRVLGLLLLLVGCARDDGSPSNSADVIELRWPKAYAAESTADVERGVLWGLSLLGARLPEGVHVIRWHQDRLSVDLARAQVIEGTQGAWRTFLATLKDSGEYRARGALDVGRFLVLALGDPTNYYRLTGAIPQYAVARARYHFDPRPAGIVASAVALGSRRIEISQASDAGQIAFVAYEGVGSFSDGSFAPNEMELLDTMPNGQLRFALYDLDGRLKRGATPALTRAGKPAKCMWCHESKLQPTFVDFHGASGFYDRQQFDTLVAQRRALLETYRDRLDTQIRFRNLQDHASVELLYTSFEEPSLQRLAAEWNLPEEQVGALLRGLPTHAQAEYPQLGSSLYWRGDVEHLAPYGVLAAPRSVREEGDPLAVTATVQR